jgi:abhydrolase domain-containing protein 12
MASEMAVSLFKYASTLVALAAGLYATLLGLLTTATFQSQVIYLHAIQMTWFKNLIVPESFGFLKNQVTPFSRISNYRALSAGDPRKIQVLTFDYRGFGSSTGTPSESGLIIDALAVVDWAMNIASIPPSHILIFAQSMGTAVGLAVSHHFALQSPPVVFADTVLVAPFVDVATLSATYRVAGTIPILSPLAKFPLLINYFEGYIRDKWLSKDRIEWYVRANEANGKRYR